MRGKVGLSRFLCSLFAVLFSTAAFAQFTSSVQGVVQDPSGASVAKATVQIVNRDTQFTQTTTTDADTHSAIQIPPLTQAPTSRPSASVPSKCPALPGGRNAAPKSTAVGLGRATTPSTPIPTITSRIASPAARL